LGEHLCILISSLGISLSLSLPSSPLLSLSHSLSLPLSLTLSFSLPRSLLNTLFQMHTATGCLFSLSNFCSGDSTNSRIIVCVSTGTYQCAFKHTFSNTSSRQ
jgi:hypothetical protein